VCTRMSNSVCCACRQSLLQAQVHLRSARPPPAAAQPHAALRALHQALSASAAGSAPTQPAAPAHPAQIDNPENGWQATRQASGAAELSPRSAPAGRAGQRRYAADGQVPESSGVAAMRASRTQADAAGSGYAGGGLRGSAQDGGAVAGLAGAGKPGAAGSACTDRRAGGAERGAPDLCALAVWAAVAWSAAADVLLQAAGDLLPLSCVHCICSLALWHHSRSPVQALLLAASSGWCAGC
jgi:hypothetical protein